MEEQLESPLEEPDLGPRPAGAPAPEGRTAAEPVRRLGAALFDLGLALITLIPAYVILSQFLAQPPPIAVPLQDLADPGTLGPSLDDALANGTVRGALVVSSLLLTALGGLQAWLLAGGQTIGKRLLGLQIVRAGGEPATLAHTLWLRGVMFAGLWLAIPIIGWVVVPLVDLALLFGEDRRTLHDLLAGTTVVDAIG